MTEIEMLKKQYPELQYKYYCLWHVKSDTLLCDEQETVRLLNDHYDGRSIVVGDGSGNPEKEESIEVEGHIYISETLNGDYELAFNQIIYDDSN